MDATKTEIVLFDLGGVLVNFRGVSPMGKFAGITDPEWPRLKPCQDRAADEVDVTEDSSETCGKISHCPQG